MKSTNVDIEGRCKQLKRSKNMNMSANISAINFLAAYKYGKKSRLKHLDKTTSVKQEGQHISLLIVST